MLYGGNGAYSKGEGVLIGDEERKGKFEPVQMYVTCSCAVYKSNGDNTLTLKRHMHD